MAASSSPRPAKDLSTGWSMNIKTINTGFSNSTGIQITCELCWNGHVMGSSLCSLVMNERRDIYPPGRKHEISSTVVIISLDVLNVLGEASCPCTFLKPQRCPCKHGIADCLRLSIFSCLKHTAARTVWILPLASPCLLLSRISVPSILIQKPSELYLWAAGEGGTLLWK